jgi:hypothetical protein
MRAYRSVADCGNIVRPAGMEFESVLQILFSFYWFVTQLPGSEEFKMASLASCQKGRLGHIFENQ